MDELGMELFGYQDLGIYALVPSGEWLFLGLGCLTVICMYISVVGSRCFGVLATTEGMTAI